MILKTHPARIELAHMAPEAIALSPELRVQNNISLDRFYIIFAKKARELVAFYISI